jgi:FkbM family methyltransferase
MHKYIKFLLKSIRHPNFFIYYISKKYIHLYEGFSYNFNVNGERSILNKIKMKQLSVLFDVGANIGDWSNMALSIFPNAHVFSFELSKETFQTLQSNLSCNISRATLNNYGLSNKNEEVFYKDYGQNSGVNTILSNTNFHDESLSSTLKLGNLITGDYYCKLNSINYIDFLKIDVEGAEHLVLEGFAEMLQNKAIRIIQFEYGYTHGDAHFLMKDFYNLLNSNGYILGPLKPTGVMFMDFNYHLNGFESGPNFIAVLKSDTEIINLIKSNTNILR